MGINYGDVSSVLDNLKKAQDAEHDLRVEMREAVHFIHKKDGQWEPEILRQFSKKPRYTFDLTTPIIDQISGEMENADFSLRVRPSGGDASKDVAQTFDGLIRNIRNISNAEHVFNASGRNMVISGQDGWEIVQEYADSDTFDQDLVIKKIHNWVDRVWFDPGAEEQDNSDANWVIVLQAILRDDFEEQFPDKNVSSVTEDRNAEVYSYKPDFVIIGRIQYKKKIPIKLLRMSNGAVYEENEDFEKVRDELAANGITVVDERERDTFRVHQRLFSGSDWLNEEEETVFDFLPVCAAYGNYAVSENKRITKGAVEPLMDPARVYNYAASRQIEETALSPRQKLMMTGEQMKGYSKTLSSMNTNTDPVQGYNHVDGHAPPYQVQGPQANQALSAVLAATSNNINAISGLFSANLGDNPGLQSGVAIEQQISKGDNGTVKWFKAMEVAICYTGKVLINAIPRAYDATRQVRILQEDGSFEMVLLNEPVIDEETKQTVVLNDLSKGVYDVVCEMGPAFKSRQKETAAAIAELARFDESIMQIGSDVFLNNTDAPGVDIVAQRKRAMMLQQGLIPPDQWTDEERQMMDQQAALAQQNQKQDPADILAQAEMLKGEADILAQQNKNMELMLRNRQIENEEERTDLEARRLELQAAEKGLKALSEQQKQISEELENQASTLKTLKEVSGADGLMSPELVRAIAGQVQIILAEQGNQEELDQLGGIN